MLGVNSCAAWRPCGNRPWRYVLTAFIGLAAILSVQADASCIVSGNTSRDAASSGVSALDGDWFDSSAFSIVAKPLQRVFNSYPPGFILSFR